MSKEWKTAAEAYAISTDGNFEYAKSWEEVRDIFMDGANYASKAYIQDLENVAKECEKYKSSLQRACELLREINTEDTSGWHRLNAHDRALLLELEAIFDT